MSRLGIDAAAWERLSPLLDQALALPPEQRLAWLDALPAISAPWKDRLRAQLSNEHTATVLRGLPSLGTGDGDAGHAAGERVGVYRLLQLLGRGGMGTVWLAERCDVMLKRPVALKLPHAGFAGFNQPGLAARLAREREILAVLDHPNIAKLYDAGVAERGQPYLALEHVQGVSIDAYCRRKTLGLRERLLLLLQVAQAVGHAHANLIVHRDLKPSNILVTEGGQVRLLDFGIAKLLDDGGAPDDELTQQLGRALTLRYAAPEQVQGQAVGTACDIYALGVVMYELLCGRSPYRPARDTQAALEDAVLHDEPLRPSASLAADPLLPLERRQLRGDLDTIALKALKKLPEERYPSVASLAEDLRRHLDHRPVLARPPSLRYRSARFVQRNSAVLAGCTAVSLALLVGAGATIWQAAQARAQTGALQQTREFIVSLLGDADPYLEPSRALPARELLDRARERLETLSAARAGVRVELLNLIGWNLTRLQRLDDGAAVAAQALRESRAALPQDHPQALRARLMQVVVWRNRGQPREIRAELDRLLPALRKRAGADPTDLIIALRNDANFAATAERRPDHAMRAAREAIALSRARFGELHAQTVMSHAVLISAAVGAVGTDEALAISSEGLALAERVYGGRGPSPMLIQMRMMHVGALSHAGRYEQAIDAVRQNLADSETVFGPGVLGEAHSSSQLSQLLVATGDLDSALLAIERSRTIFERLAPDSAHLASALTQRGIVRLLAGRANDAAEDLSAAHALHVRTQGESHETSQSAAVLRGLALAHAGQGVEALRASSPPSAGHPMAPRLSALAHHVAGVVYLRAGDAARALDEQRIALELAQRAEGGRDRVRLTWLDSAAAIEAARALHALGSSPEAVVMLEGVERRLAAFQPPGAPLREAARAELHRVQHSAPMAFASNR